MVLRGGCVDCEFLSMLGAATPAARGRSRGEEEGGAKSPTSETKIRDSSFAQNHARMILA
jgi:hypothetical protein